MARKRFRHCWRVRNERSRENRTSSRSKAVCPDICEGGHSPNEDCDLSCDLSTTAQCTQPDQRVGATRACDQSVRNSLWSYYVRWPSSTATIAGRLLRESLTHQVSRDGELLPSGTNSTSSSYVSEPNLFEQEPCRALNRARCPEIENSLRAFTRKRWMFRVVCVLAWLCSKCWCLQYDHRPAAAPSWQENHSCVCLAEEVCGVCGASLCANVFQ